MLNAKLTGCKPGLDLMTTDESSQDVLPLNAPVTLRLHTGASPPRAYIKGVPGSLYVQGDAVITGCERTLGISSIFNRCNGHIW